MRNIETCSSCGIRLIDRGSAEFPCPDCGDTYIGRCPECRDQGVGYDCPDCSFHGP